MKSMELSRKILLAKQEWERTFDSINGPVCIIDSNHVIKRLNKAMADLIGIHIKEAIGLNCYKVVHKTDAPPEYCPFRKFIKDGIISAAEVKVNDKWYDIAVSPVFDADGNTTSCVHAMHDITQRKLTEERLRSSEQRYRDVVENTHDAIIIDDVEGNVIFANSRFFNLFGFSQEELHSLKMDDYITPEYLPLLRERHCARIRGEKVPTHFECQGLRRDGERLWLDINVVAITDLQGKVINTQSTIHNITNRKNTEVELFKREQYRNLILQTTQDGFLTFTKEGRVTEVNEAYCRMSGYSRNELTKLTIDDIAISYSNSEKDAIIKSIIENGSALFESQHRRKDGSCWDAEVSASFLGNETGLIIAFCRNITERKKQLEYLFNMEKHETLSVMTRGIAHDFNNLLTGIYNYIYLAKAETKDKGIAFYFDKTLNTIDRAKNLSMQLLTFTGNCPPIKKRHSIFPFVKDVAEFILCGTNISCQFNVPKKIWKCYFDKNQIGQVFDNIIINAKQSMPNGGKIFISAENVTFKKNEDLILRRGNYVKISIRDSGVGIPKEILQKVFEPFFSTKQQGTGLGLSTAYSIIKMHNGKINVESEIGKGSIFHIYLPASLKSNPSSEPEQETERIHRGKGRILIMDDEECVRQSLKLILESMGYCVDSARNGDKALDLFRESERTGQPFVAVILDLTISSGMNGIETVKEMRLLNSEIPIFASSGYSDIKTLENVEDYGFNDYLPKPYLSNDLGNLLNRYLKNYSTEVARTDNLKNETAPSETTPMRADKSTVLISETIHSINNQNHVIMLNSSVVRQALNEILEIIKDSYDSTDKSIIGLPIGQAVETLSELIAGIEKGSRKIKEIIQERK